MDSLSKQKPPVRTQTLETTVLPALRQSPPRWRMPLIDLALAFIAFGLAYLVRYELQILRPVNEANQAPFVPYLPFAGIFLVMLLVSYQSSRLYRPIRGRSLMEEVSIIINGVMSSTVLLMAISFVTQPLVFSRLMMIYVAAITIALLTLARVVRRVVQASLRAQGVGVERVLVIGAGDVGRSVLRTMIARKELGYFPVGYLDHDPDVGSVNLGRMQGLGGLDRLEPVIYEQDVDTVVITLSWEHHNTIMDMIDLCQRFDVNVQVVPDVFQLNLSQVQIANLDGIPLLNIEQTVRFNGINRFVKRALDLTLIVLAAPLWLPLFAGVALAIRIEGPGPIFYTGQRVGENGRAFKLMKFRSMIPDADKLRADLIREAGEDPRHPKIRNDPRITRVGRFIRATSLDELPNLINVLRGEMSLVGPRPPTPDEVALYEPWHRQRLSIMPGITGLWQVSGRSDVPFDEMCLLDIYYIENWSVRLDLQLLLMTIPRVLLRQGAY